MKTLFLTVLVSAAVFVFMSPLQSKTISLTIGANNLTNAVVIGTNEVAEIKSYNDDTSFDGNAIIGVVKDGRSFQVHGARFTTGSAYARTDKLSIAGPA